MSNRDWLLIFLIFGSTSMLLPYHFKNFFQNFFLNAIKGKKEDPPLVK